MDVYEESLLNVLMPEGVPSGWHDCEDFTPYVQRLASCGLQRLSSECDSLKEEQASLLEQTKELAYKEYQTFIHASDCSKSLHSQLGCLEKQLSSTSDSVADLHATLDSFVSTSRSLLISRQLNSTTLAKHTQLLEILELSQLLDTCVRNAYHDEALEIIAYVRRLEKRHGNIPVIKSIVREVQSSSQQMLSQLLAQLRSDASLPQCLKVVGLIRTLDVFTECQLRIKFLHARDAWMNAALAAVPSHDPYQHISKTVECARVHLFDIVTQYRAIFSDEEPHCAALHHTAATDLPALLQSWLLHRVSGVLRDVRRSLLASAISGSSLESLMAQCLFFGQSLSRIGADFRGLLTEIFVAAGGRELERDVRAANHKFDEALSCYSFTDAAASAYAASGGRLVDTGMGGSSGGRPPFHLLEFPPLAHYLNGLVTALNTLRLCCFTALLPKLLGLLTISLDKVVRSLVEVHEVECAGFSAAEAASFGRLCSAVKTILLPYLNSTCLRSLYPLHHLAAVTGSSALHLAKMNFGQLDVEAICRPLEPFLPQAVPDSTEPITDDVPLSSTLSGTGNDHSQDSVSVAYQKEIPDVESLGLGSTNYDRSGESVVSRGTADSQVEFAISSFAAVETGAARDSPALADARKAAGLLVGQSSGTVLASEGLVDRNESISTSSGLRLTDSMNNVRSESSAACVSSGHLPGAVSSERPQVWAEDNAVAAASTGASAASHLPPGTAASATAPADAIGSPAGDLADVPLHD